MQNELFMIKTPFSSLENHEYFLRNGYCRFSLLSKENLESVKVVYNHTNKNDRLDQEQFYGVNYSLGTLDAKENSFIMQPIVEMLYIRLQDYFENFEILGCVFITKPSNTGKTFAYHQDWSYTDEENHSFITCWVPLLNTEKENGCMSVIAGSHIYFKTYRSDTLDSARIDFEEIPEEIRTDIEQPEGSCLAFHQALFHGSYPNKTNVSRPVLAFVVKHKESPVVHFVKDENNLSAYELSVASFNKMLNEIPKSKFPDDALKLFSKDIHIHVPDAKEIISKWRVFNENHKILRNDEHHKFFQKNGYLVLKNVLLKETLKQLRNYYCLNFSTPKGMYVTHHSESNVAKNKEVSSFINKLLISDFNAYFINYRNVIAHYAVKNTGNEGVFNLHQDWSIVREQLYGIIHVWIPLQKVNVENGTLALIPTSHLLFQNYRSGTCPIRFFTFEEVANSVIDINADEGDIVLYHPALFHGSRSNMSKNERIAVVAAVSNDNADTVYFNKEIDEVWVYEMTEEDLFGRLDNLAKGLFPKGKKIEKTYNRDLTTNNSVILSKLNKSTAID